MQDSGKVLADREAAERKKHSWLQKQYQERQEDNLFSG